MSSDSSSASRRQPDVAPRPLDGFIEAASRAGGIGVIQLDAFTTLVVRTAHSVYRITILKPYAQEVLVEGGTHFPERTRLPERVECQGQTFEDRLGWPRAAPRISCGRSADHHVTRARDRGRGAPDRRTLLADLVTTRTCAM